VIYRQGRFKWSISVGSGSIDAPPPPENLSDGDVFIRVNTDATQLQQTQVWYLSSTSSPSVLVWKAIVPLQDIRYIGSDPYILSLHVNEPSWILARSAAHPQVRSRRLNGKLPASFPASFPTLFNEIYPSAHSSAQPKTANLKLTLRLN
jgi:hypothetical protein